jgi:hypothetical protein
MRVIVIEFLDTDLFNVSADNCITFLEPVIESWDIDLATFGMEIVLNRRLNPGNPKRFEFMEREITSQVDMEPGLRAFLQDPSLRGDATAEEIEFLKTLRFSRRAADRAVLLSRVTKHSGSASFSPLERRHADVDDGDHPSATPSDSGRRARRAV